MRFLVLLFALWSLSGLARNREIIEYFDENSELFWSSDLGRMSYQDALAACEKLKLKKKTWRLPEVQEFIMAEKNSIRTKMDFENSWWWTKTIHHYYANLFNGYTGGIDGYMEYDRPNMKAMVRCVSSYSM